MTNTLSLYTIEESLADLLLAREEVRAEIAGLETIPQGTAIDAAALVESRASLAAIETTLTEYLTLEVNKVDNYHRFLSVASGLVRDLKEEEKKTATRRRRTEAAIEYLKARAAEAMKAIGKKRVEGHAGRYLLLKGNGGNKPLVVDGWDDEKERWTSQSGVLPEKYIDVTVKMSAEDWEVMLGRLDSMSFDRPELVGRIESAPNKSRIRAALDTACKICDGRKSVEHTQNGTHMACYACGGTGLTIVPGARLAERGEHIEAK